MGDWAMIFDGSTRWWLNLLWAETMESMADAESCAETVCACQCRADLAASTFVRTARIALALTAA